MSSATSSSSSSPSGSSTENNLKSNSESRSSQVGTSTYRSQVRTSTPQTSTSFRHRDALGEIKDEAEDKFDEDTWFAADEKRNKMTKESIVELLKEYPLPPPFSARVPALQEPANYGTSLETSVYEGQIRSGYRVPMHPFVVAFFNHYKMAPGQLVPNGWRKLVGLIYLVQTSGYPVTVDDFMRLYLERPSGKWEFPRKWNGFCKDFEKDGFLSPNAVTKKLLDHIKRRDVLNIDEPLTDQEMRHARLIPPASAMLISPTLVLEPRIISNPKAQDPTIDTSSSRTPSLEMAGKGVLMAMDVARNAETDKRAAEGKADKLDKEVKNLKTENADLLTKLGRLEKRCEKLRHEKSEVENKAIHAFLDGTAGDEWLWKRTEDGLSIFQEGF
ncbi:hypothetical protein RJ639_026585 [Escallonia herrerae]|uniref:Transposase (putative) gypsy type domain-containing protein n=1 Tax=Escallonia herrerae TaxID=1293975 RepID=A0AA89AC22_9ASTE|nr:hypothetical protein RJ639_026585 [Escallonia herrerae]